MPQMTLEELTAFTKAFRERAVALVGRMFSAYLANGITELLDDLFVMDEKEFVWRYLLTQKERDRAREHEKLEKNGALLSESDKIKLSLADRPHDTAYFAVLSKANERYNEIQRSQRRDPEVDFDCSACFIPLKDKIVALFYTEKDELRELWESCEEVSEYGYWNNTDPQEGVSRREWARRREDWEAALPGIGIPMEHGITADFIKGLPSRFETLSETVSIIPDLNKRVRRVAKEQVLARKFKALQEAAKDEGALDIYYQAANWLRTSEGKQEIAAEALRIAPVLIPQITQDEMLADLTTLKTPSSSPS